MLTLWIAGFCVAAVAGFLLVFATGIIARAELSLFQGIGITMAIEALHLLCATVLARWMLMIFFIAWIPMLAMSLKAFVPISIWRALLVALVVAVIQFILMTGVIIGLIGSTYTA